MITLYIKVIYTPPRGRAVPPCGRTSARPHYGRGGRALPPHPRRTGNKDFQADGKEKNMCSGNDGSVTVMGVLADVSCKPKAARLMVELDPGVASLTASRIVPLVGSDVSVRLVPMQGAFDIKVGE